MVKKQYDQNYFSLGLSRILKDRKIDQKQLAEISGINQSNISGYASGRTSPTMRAMCKIANCIGIDLVDLLVVGRSILTGEETPLSYSSSSNVGESLKDELIEAHRKIIKLQDERNDLALQLKASEFILKQLQERAEQHREDREIFFASEPPDAPVSTGPSTTTKPGKS